jgi:hypothetical protein
MLRVTVSLNWLAPRIMESMRAVRSARTVNQASVPTDSAATPHTITRSFTCKLTVQSLAAITPSADPSARPASRSQVTGH